MKKIKYQTILDTMTPFFVHHNIEQKYSKERGELIANMQKHMTNIHTYSGLTEFIRSNPNSLLWIIALLGASGEFLKRIISLFRIEKGHLFTTEWSLERAQTMISQDDALMKKMCDLFLNGPQDPVLTKQIPLLKLKDFHITPEVVARLSDNSLMDHLIRQSQSISYTSAISKENVSCIERIIYNQKKIHNFIIEKQGQVDPIGDGTRNIPFNFALTWPEKKQPSLYIKFSFSITTSTLQSAFNRAVKDMRDFLRSTNSEATQVVIVDGAGWIARQSDLHDIWDYSTFCLNLEHIGQLENIINTQSI